jgi:hypothetical protein
MIVLYTLIIWKMYRNSTAMRMRSYYSKRFIDKNLKKSNFEFFLDGNSSKTRSNSSSPGFVSINKCSQYKSVRSHSVDHKAKQSLNFEKFGPPSSHHSSSRSRSNFSDEDQGQNRQSDISLRNQQFSRMRSTSHPITRPLTQYTHYQPTNMSKRFFHQISFRDSSVRSHFSSSHGISRMDRHRRKALKLLITLIVEFFVCWTPLFIFHTLATFNKKFYRLTPSVCVDLILLFSFASASCNPLTYYFMSKRYRSVLYAYLPCCFCNNNQRMYMNQKNEQARHLIKAIRSHQQQNSNEKKRKVQTRIDMRHPRLRSKTLY